MKLQDCKTLVEIYTLELAGKITKAEAYLRAAEIGGEKVKEAAASAIEDGARHGGLYANTLIRALDVKQIIEGE